MGDTKLTNTNGVIRVKSDNLFIYPIAGQPRGIILYDKDPNNVPNSAPILSLDTFEKLEYEGNPGSNIVQGILPEQHGKTIQEKKSPIIQIDTGDGDDKVVLIRSKRSNPNFQFSKNTNIQINTGLGNDLTIVEIPPTPILQVFASSKAKKGEKDKVGLLTSAPFPVPYAILLEANPGGDNGSTEVGYIQNPDDIYSNILGNNQNKIQFVEAFERENKGSLLQDNIHKTE